MATQIPSTFTRYQLTPEEQTSGAQFTSSNLFVIQNLICDIAEEKLSLKLDPMNPLQFTQREAELQGQLGILQLIVQMATALPPTDSF